MSAFSDPADSPAFQQHEVANPANAARLLAALPEQPGILAELKGKHILSIAHFSPDLIRALLRQAAACEAGLAQTSSLATCKVLGGIFLDGSRHDIHLPFIRGFHCLGGHFIDLGSPAEDILRARRDLAEISALANSYSDIAVASTAHADLFAEILPAIRVPLINAGNGDDEAPVQALTDLYTLAKWRPALLQRDVPAKERLRIGIFGTPGNTATLRSLLSGLALFPQMVERVVMLDRSPNPCSPGQREALERAGLKLAHITELYPNETVMGGLGRIVPELDVIYSHLKQQHAVSRMDMLEFKKLFNEHLLLLSPQRQLPDFSALVNNSSHNGFFTQAKSAVFILMALLGAVLA